MGDTERECIFAGNEALYREINEIIKRGQWPGEEHPRAFRCECGRLRCAELIELTPQRYEAIRANPRWFLLVEGHEDPTLEQVVQRHEDYIVVEKRGPAGAVAAASDPRS